MNYNKLILFKDSKLLLLEEPAGKFRLPFEGEVTISDCSEDEIFHLEGYVAKPMPREDEILMGSTTSGVKPRIVGLRESWTLLPEADYRAAAKGAELLNWSSATRYCSRCGFPLRRNTEISKICTNPECKREVFPSLWPAIVVLVTKPSPDGDPAKDTALLVHARTLSRPTVQTLVAGFVETGESLEECVAREVREETSLEIEDIRYVGSQSWPFPHQLMLGFRAKYRSGDVKFADGELTSGGFFTRDSLPDLPTLPSLSRRIIDTWASEFLSF